MTENPLTKEYWLGSVDARPLALFRVLFGSVVLVDLLHRMSDVRAFLSDEGFAPRVSIPGATMNWSVFRWVGTPTSVMVLYVAGCVVVAAFLVGFRTRLAQAGMFAFLASLYFRNPNFGDLGQDRVMGIMSFWLLFADSGAVWSLDSLLEGRTRRSVSAIGPRLMQWQIGLIILFSGLHKWGTWNDGLAIYRFLQIRVFATPLGAILAAHPGMCSALTWSTMLLEVLVPILLIPMAPLSPKWTRAAGLLGGIGLFLGILAFLEVGAFPEVMLAGLALFVLPEWLDRMGWVLPPVAEGAAEPSGPAGGQALTRTILPLLGIAQLGVVIWSMIAPWTGVPVGSLIRDELKWTNLKQEWLLFKQTKGLSNSWWTDVGTLADGTTREVVAAVAPELVVGDSPERHWEHLRYLLSRSHEFHEAMTGYICREFNRASATRLAELELRLHELAVADPGEPPAAETVRMFRDLCP